MKKYFVLTSLIFLSMLLVLKAQEKKKVHLKIIKNENGKITKIDSVLEVKDHKGVFFYGDDLDEGKLDSILQALDFVNKEGVKVFSITDDIEAEDGSIVWLTTNANSEEDTLELKKFIFTTKDDEDNLVKREKEIIWLLSDSSEMSSNIHFDHADNVFVMKTEDGNKIKITKSEKGKPMIWTSDSLGEFTINKKENVIVYSTGDKTFDILKSDDESDLLEEIIVKKGFDEETMSVFITKEGEHTVVKLGTLDDDSKKSDKKVRIYEYKTDDGNTEFKAEISDDVKKDSKLCEMKIIKGEKEGVFTIDFKLEEKLPTIIKVESEDGKTVYTKKIKKFNGEYSTEIDLSDKPNGNYILQIIQDDKIVIKEKLKK